GPKIFFPNIIFRMIRSPPGYLPNQVVFRVPPHVNKLDIRTYLERLYGVTVTDVRTANYMEKVKWKELARATRSLVRREKRGMGLRPTRVPAYKRAIVTVTEDFRWPDAP
ncbi:ribosomal protein L23/L15e core domain-containing protein, partial [Hyaloraphidium curvatum]